MAAHPLELNLWELNRDFARCPSAIVHDDADLLWYSCPGSNSWLNGASRCRLGSDAEAVVERAVATWRALGAAAMWHQTPSSAPPRLPEILASHGFEPHHSPGMAMAVRRESETSPPELTIEEVADAAGVRRWVNTFDVAFGSKARDLAHPWLAPFTALYLSKASPGRLFLGSVDGVPVSTSLAFVGGTAVGIYGVGTIPDQRGHGYGAAMTRSAIAWGHARGATTAVLESSQLGLSVYRRLGFETVFETTAWVRPASRDIQ